MADESTIPDRQDNKHNIKVSLALETIRGAFPEQVTADNQDEVSPRGKKKKQQHSMIQTDLLLRSRYSAIFTVYIKERGKSGFLLSFILFSRHVLCFMSYSNSLYVKVAIRQYNEAELKTYVYLRFYNFMCAFLVEVIYVTVRYWKKIVEGNSELPQNGYYCPLSQ